MRIAAVVCAVTGAILLGLALFAGYNWVLYRGDMYARSLDGRVTAAADLVILAGMCLLAAGALGLGVGLWRRGRDARAALPYFTGALALVSLETGVLCVVDYIRFHSEVCDMRPELRMGLVALIVAAALAATTALLVRVARAAAPRAHTASDPL